MESNGGPRAPPSCPARGIESTHWPINNTWQKKKRIYIFIDLKIKTFFIQQKKKKKRKRNHVMQVATTLSSFFFFLFFFFWSFLFLQKKKCLPNRCRSSFVFFSFFFFFCFSFVRSNDSVAAVFVSMLNVPL